VHATSGDRPDRNSPSSGKPAVSTVLKATVLSHLRQQGSPRIRPPAVACQVAAFLQPGIEHVEYRSRTLGTCMFPSAGLIVRRMYPSQPSLSGREIQLGDLKVSGWWGGWGSNPRPADYEKYGPVRYER
jgi:hypothetical protein